MLDDTANFAAKYIALEVAYAVQVKLVNELAVNFSFEIVELTCFGGFVGKCLDRNRPVFTGTKSSLPARPDSVEFVRNY